MSFYVIAMYDTSPVPHVFGLITQIANTHLIAYIVYYRATKALRIKEPPRLPFWLYTRDIHSLLDVIMSEVDISILVG